MSQIKIYALRDHLTKVREPLSDVIHSCVMDVLGLPEGKRAHRFIHLSREDFYMPEGRTDAYTILEISMISGRSKESKKKLVSTLFDRIENLVGVNKADLEICIYESPGENWGFRGMHGDEVRLPYNIKI
tara:strand:- start:1743 stop:2132 length:390 start_codon:yes stop_codon:yes gene_type:complete